MGTWRLGCRVILGLAGHIDHGKTALVKALTGVDTDRLPEERRRGITIELGFAPLALPGVGTLGVVDVPGHEAFVRTMLAGASGMDLALLVVAADEGVMPQTREHLAILGLLGIRTGVVALTKVDLVDADWLALVREDVFAAVAGTALDGAAIVATSVTTGVGLDALRTALAAAAAAVPARDAEDLFRLPVDRAFTIHGTGTVVTGTVWSGQLARDATVRILPGGHTARIRGLQSHGASVDHVGPGVRVAVSLGGVEVGEVPRGSTLVTDAGWTETRIVRADVALLGDADVTLGPRTPVRFHLGTRDVGARIVAVNGPLTGAAVRAVRVVLDARISARAGDRFVLRTLSPVSTVGGGVITDPAPWGRRVRPWAREKLSPAERLTLVVGEAGGVGLETGTLAVRLGFRAAHLESTLHEHSQDIASIGDRLFDMNMVHTASTQVMTMVDAFHHREPLEDGMSLQSVRGALAVAPALADEVLRQLVASGGVVVERGLVRRAGFTAEPRDQEERVNAVERVLHRSGREPPSVSELTAEFGSEVGAVLRYLERRRRIVQVEPDRYYAAPVVEGIVADLRKKTETGRPYGPSELRGLLGVSRKYLIPLLEYCDRQSVTVRSEAGRVVQAGVTRNGSNVYDA